MMLAESDTELHKALELSPLSLIINTNIADGHYYRGEYAQGIEQAKKVIDMDPGFSVVYPTLIQLYLEAKETDKALEALEKYAGMTEPTDAKVTRAYVYAKVGRTEEARRILGELEGSGSAREASPYFLSVCRFNTGDMDRGFELLEEAYRRHDRYILLMGIDKDLGAARTDPRYARMLQKVGLAKYFVA